jgi:hypothetical protein
MPSCVCAVGGEHERRERGKCSCGEAGPSGYAKLCAVQLETTGHERGKRCAGEAGASGDAERRVLLREASTSERASEASTAIQRGKHSHTGEPCVLSRVSVSVSVCQVCQEGTERPH